MVFPLLVKCKLLIFVGVGYHDSSIKSSLCHLCRAVLSNQNALRYHLNYVHGIHGEPSSNHGLIQSYSDLTTTASSTATASRAIVTNASSNNKKASDTLNDMNSNATPIVKSEVQ